MIAARQISKPVADAVLRYGKNHPLFRNKILIPIGRGLVRLTTRLRMKRLGLGEPVSIPAVSEAAALEQASDFVQQLVLFSYSLGVFYGYYMYTKLTTPETVKLHEFEEFREESEKVMVCYLIFSCIIPVYTPPPPSKKEGDPEQTSQKEEKKDEGAEKPKARFPRISSLPVDSASNVVLRGELQFVNI
ncbi:unnamed protein product [Nippostrongylus brasiliensis]|uniref:Mitofilin n=1 Tax=Nippostrongylus brasiliensis TaxID=27835 RepID=A0A0N4XHH6_NIPBR|nr:unnamed protein product [Nippostrongylus brasiliensis]